jgi:hypothetical protein
MSDNSNNRFIGDARAITPLGRATKTEDRTSPEDRRAKERADAILDEVHKPTDD